MVNNHFGLSVKSKELARIFHEFTPWRDCDHETGNPLVADTACGAGLSGLSRRSFSEDGSAASANNMAVLPGVLGFWSLRRTVQVRLETNPAVPRDGC